MKKKVSMLASILLVSSIGLGTVVPAHADFWDAYKDTWHMSASSKKAATKIPTIAKIKASSTVETFTPVLLKHNVCSDGVSIGSLSNKIGGYKYKIPSKGHQITATVSGIGVKISATDIPELKETSNSQTFYANAETIDYTIEAECYSLVGYKEKHTYKVDAYAPVNRKNPQNTIIVTCTASIY